MFPSIAGEAEVVAGAHPVRPGHLRQRLPRGGLLHVHTPRTLAKVGKKGSQSA